MWDAGEDQLPALGRGGSTRLDGIDLLSPFSPSSVRGGCRMDQGVTFEEGRGICGEKETAILRKSYLFGLSALQLHGGESLDEIQRLQELAELKIWKVIPVGGEIDWKAWEAFVPYVDRFLFDTDTKSKGGSGKTFDWKLLESYPFETGFVLGGGLSLAHADELVALSQKFPQLLGVDVNSGFEFAPGVKKIADLKAFKEKLKS